MSDALVRAAAQVLGSAQLVVFDLDGTLIDAFGDIADAANRVRAANGLAPLPVDEIKRHVGYGARVLLQGVLGTDDPAVIDENYQRLIEMYQSATETHAEFYPGALELVRLLRERGAQTAVASNKPHPLTVATVAQLGAASLFDFVFGERPEVPRKPAHDLMMELLIEAGVLPSAACMVGDTEVDMAFAHGVPGVRALAVGHGQRPLAELLALKPDGAFENFEAVLALLRP